ncbi:hypothetical protein TNCV_774041 [Trichonephila clavipes]|nr:hypothetical protein TNCV_774041 [Trichonephila clavipes]
MCRMHLSEGRFDLSTFRSERTNEASTLTITPKRSSSWDVVLHFLANVASFFVFKECDTEIEHLRETDEYDNDSDMDLSICDEEDEEIEPKGQNTYITHVEKLFVPKNISRNFIFSYIPQY